MTTKLILYNEALGHLGDPRLSTDTDDVSSRYDLDRVFSQTVIYVFEEAAWRFALKTVALVATTGPIPGFANVFSKPADWLKTKAVFKLSGSRECPIDIKEQDTKVYTNAAAVTMRYISNAFLTDYAVWPEHFAKAVAARLAFEVATRLTSSSPKAEEMFAIWRNLFAEALRLEAMTEDRWLLAQQSGELMPVVRELLEHGMWRFAMKTADVVKNVSTPSQDYSYAFTKPADWLRTFHLYRTLGGGATTDIDFREEGGMWHANWDPITVRYLSSTLGEDSSLWSSAFEQAVLAKIAFKRALTTPGVAGAQIEALGRAAEEALKEARRLDDARERPPVLDRSAFIAARWGGSSYSREQGWYP